MKFYWDKEKRREEVAIFELYGLSEVCHEEQNISAPHLSSLRETRDSSFVKAEGRPNGGCRAVKENESRPWLTRRDSNPHLIGYEPTALTITPQVNVVLAEP